MFLPRIYLNCSLHSRLVFFRGYPTVKVSVFTVNSDDIRETVPSHNSDMGKKIFLVLAHSFLLP